LPFHVLHVAADPEMRDTVAHALGSEPTFAVLSCGWEDDAVRIMARWRPDLVLCDADGSAAARPDLLIHPGDDPVIHLDNDPTAARVPIVFTLPRDQPAAIERVKSLGAAGVILKPLDPTTLADCLRDYLRRAKLDTMRGSFSERLRLETAVLTRCERELAADPPPQDALDELQTHSHKLAGAAGVFGFQNVSSAASRLEQSVILFRCGGAPIEKLADDVKALRVCLDRT
jgi:two-component system, OmpR family, response regulator